MDNQTTVAISIPGYRIERLIAEGGMASVYLAQQESLGRSVALKLLRKFDNPTESVRFLNEAKIIASLNHHNIVTIHDIGSVGDRHFISTEFLEGGDLRKRMERAIEGETALQLLETIGECLAFVHQRGVIHRDIKPENILFRADGTAILTDFGIAKQLHLDSSLTMDGVALGSPHYLSPEQATAKHVDARTDLYSLGIVCYEMLTGKRPYEGDSQVNIIMAHLTEPQPQLPGLLQRFQPLLDRMIAKNPEDRFASANELVRHIRQLRTCPVSAPTLEWTPYICLEPRRTPLISRRPLAILCSVVGLLAIAAAVATGLGRATAPRMVTTTSASTAESAAAQELGNGPIPAASKPRMLASDHQGPGAGPREPAKESPDTSVWMNKQIRPDVATKKQRAVQLGTQTEIDEYLHQGIEALSDYRLTTPAQDSAFFYFQRILKLDPDNQAAQRGITDIADTYADLAMAALKKFKYVKAKRYLRRGLAVQADNERLKAIEPRTRVAKDVGNRIKKEIESWF